MRKLGSLVDLAAAFDASPNPYMVLDARLRYVGLNQAYLDVTQRRREELIGQDVMETFDGGSGPAGASNAGRLKASFEKVLATGEADQMAVLHYPIPVPGPDGQMTYEDRFWSCTHTPIKDADGRVAYILQHTSDITALERLRHELERKTQEIRGTALDTVLGGGVFRRAMDIQEDNRRLTSERDQLLDMFMQAPGFIAILNGPEHVFQMHNPAYGQLIGRRNVIGRPLLDALPELRDQAFVAVLDEVFATGEPYQGRQSLVRLQQSSDAPAQTFFLDFMYQPIRNEQGVIIGIFVQGHDATDTVIAAERQKLMIDELNHRVKNTLATVQSIAMQTARSSTDPSAFAETFQSRLLALSHTHNLLTLSHWEGADLRAVLQHETEAHGPGRMTLNGPYVALEPHVALSLGMIFHELATNAAKYGALSTASGRVLVDWSMTELEGPSLSIRWRETGGPPVAPSGRKGFGSRLIERSVRHDLGGSGALAYATDGLQADFDIPLNRNIRT